ncbi:hypothetical protein B0H10DRAFT_1666176, partial [Mycena sp. CBHHK59/15]
FASFVVEKISSGVQWCWKDLQGFDLPENIKCWPVAVLPGAQMDCQIIHQVRGTRMADAWQFLLENATTLGQGWNVPPESLILITQSGTSQSFSINDF